MSLTVYERQARLKGFNCIAGIDEAGRGPLAGPVVAAACILDPSLFFPEADDSKKLTPEVREKLYKELTNHPKVQFGVGIISHEIIDKINIYQATIQAMLAALLNLPNAPDYLLVDGLKLPHPTIPSEKIIKGDQLSHSIACASIIAKVTRDKLMEELDLNHPHWGFKKHKGYATPEHLRALDTHGPSPIHRTSFEPVKFMVAKEAQLQLF